MQLFYANVFFTDKKTCPIVKRCCWCLAAVSLHRSNINSKNTVVHCSMFLYGLCEMNDLASFIGLRVLFFWYLHHYTLTLQIMHSPFCCLLAIIQEVFLSLWLPQQRRPQEASLDVGHRNSICSHGWCGKINVSPIPCSQIASFPSFTLILICRRGWLWVKTRKIYLQVLVRPDFRCFRNNFPFVLTYKLLLLNLSKLVWLEAIYAILSWRLEYKIACIIKNKQVQLHWKYRTQFNLTATKVSTPVISRTPCTIYVSLHWRTDK